MYFQSTKKNFFYFNAKIFTFDMAFNITTWHFEGMQTCRVYIVKYETQTVVI